MRQKSTATTMRTLTILLVFLVVVCVFIAQHPAGKLIIHPNIACWIQMFIKDVRQFGYLYCSSSVAIALKESGQKGGSETHALFLCRSMVIHVYLQDSNKIPSTL
jgi:hypothetical protein